MPTKKPRKLREPHTAVITREQAFLDAYLADPLRNAFAAALRAGYTQESARDGAKNILARPRVQELIADYEANELARIRQRTGVHLEPVLRSIAGSAFADVRKLFNEDGSPKPVHELDNDTARCIEGIEVLEQFEGSGEDRVFVGYVKKYKLARRAPAQDMLMKHLNAYAADNKSKGEAIANGVMTLLNQLHSQRSALPVVQRVDDALEG